MNSIFLRPLVEKFFYVLKKQCGNCQSELGGRRVVWLVCWAALGRGLGCAGGSSIHQYRVHNAKSAVFERVV